MCFERESRICLAKVTHIISPPPQHPPNHLPWGYLLLPTSAALESCLHSRCLFHLCTATEPLVRVKYGFNLCLPGSYTVEVIYTSFRCPHLYNRLVENHPSTLRFAALHFVLWPCIFEQNPIFALGSLHKKGNSRLHLKRQHTHRPKSLYVMLLSKLALAAIHMHVHISLKDWQ